MMVAYYRDSMPVDREHVVEQLVEAGLKREELEGKSIAELTVALLKSKGYDVKAKPKGDSTEIMVKIPDGATD